MKQIEIISKTHGKHIVLIDDEDFIKVNQYKWYVLKDINTYYACTHEKGKYNKVLYLHRFILDITDSNILVDHEDRNGLNCQKNNIRIATKSQNAINKNSHGKSKYLGVSIFNRKYKNIKGIIKITPCWVSAITSNGKRKHLGTFKTELEAAIAYDKAAKEAHGKFANLNFKENG